MRIIAGKYKGRKIESPNNRGTHPMGEREKIALFNMLGNDLSDLEILDAYAGSGALGIEALSRNAKKVVFIEKSPKVSKIIRENLDAISEIEKNSYEIICEDVKKYESTTLFDIIIADPPYDNFKADEVELLLKFLKTGGIFVLSYPKSEKIEFSGLKMLKNRHYSASGIAIFET